MANPALTVEVNFAEAVLLIFYFCPIFHPKYLSRYERYSAAMLLDRLDQEERQGHQDAGTRREEESPRYER